MADNRLRRLLERGLRHFALGEVDRAVACWREVLAVEPDNRRALEYLELVASVLPPEADLDALGMPLVGGEGASVAASEAPAGHAAEAPGFGARSGAMEPPEAAGGPAGCAKDPEEGNRASTRTTAPAPGVGRAASAPGAPATPPAGDRASRAPRSTGAAPAPTPSRPTHSDPASGTNEAAFAFAAAAAAEPAGLAAPRRPRESAPSPDPWFVDDRPEVPPVAADGLPWREWHSEIATGEFFFDEEERKEPVEAAPPDPEQLLGSIGEGAWTPGPGSTAWDLAAAGAALEVGGDEEGDALGLLGEEKQAPVAVPAALVGHQTPGPNNRADADTLMEGARELFALGDFSGSLELVQKALELDPQHAQALAYLERNQETLVQMYESKVGSLDTRPRVVLRPDEIVWLNLDHRAGFVLAQIDGTVTIDDLYALSGLSRLDTAKILAELVEQGVIAS